MSRSISASKAIIVAAVLSACSGQEFDQAERQAIASMSIDRLGSVPADPSNRFADNRAAAAFGATLFFEPRLSGDGRVSCATCHQQDRQFQDGRPLGRAAGLTDRRTMPLAGVSYSTWQFWDGRADSLWAQALSPLEDAREHAGNRTAFAHVVAEHLNDRYERIFGALPDLDGLPRNAGPNGSGDEIAAWQAMTPVQRAEIDRVFVNLGKAIAAFVRSIQHGQTRFDRFANALAKGGTSGEDDFSDVEKLGLKLFIGRANCVTCHAGPRFTDDHFHNTGVAQPPGLPEDLGRAAGVGKALADPFNCLGAHSDAKPGQCGELRFVANDNPEMRRAFKTPSLRGAASRPPYMHSGQIGTLPEVVDHYAAAPAAAAGESELLPLTLSERERTALIAFLKTLE